MLQYTYDLDMTPGNAPLVIHLNQYDDDWRLIFNLFSSSGTLDIESGSTASIRGTKADGNGYSVNVTYDEPRTRVVVGGYNQMTAAAGRNVFELVMKNSSGKILSTQNFIVDVEPAALDANTIRSNSVLKELEAIISSVSAAQSAATRAESALSRIRYSDYNNDGNLRIGGSDGYGGISRGSVGPTSGLSALWEYNSTLGIFTLRISGTTAAPLSISQGYFEIGSIPTVTSDFGFDIISFAALNSYYRAQIAIRKSSGSILIGYGRNAADNTNADIPADTQIYVNEVFLAK